MLRIGLTGSIATGKSTALKAFAALGLPTYSADAAVHELYEGEAAPAIETLFPGVTRGGAVDRDLLSARIAQAPERIVELESVVHPLVREKVFGFFDAAEAEGADIAVVEVPLLFETASRYPVDLVVVTHCTEAVQRERALSRPGMTGDKLEMVLRRQMPQDEKLARADFAIDTSGPVEDSRTRIAEIVETLRARGE